MSFLARIDPELIVWLIVVFFWVVAQVIDKIKQATGKEEKRPPRRSAPPTDAAGQPSMEDDLRDFLESLTGYAEEEEEVHEEWHPKPQAEPEPATVVRLDPPPPPPPPLPEPVLVQAKPNADTDFKAIKEIEDIKETIHLSHQSAVTQSSLLHMQTIKLATVPMPAFHTQAHDHPSKPPKFKNRKAFKDAVMAQVVLGPCKALERPES